MFVQTPTTKKLNGVTEFLCDEHINLSGFLEVFLWHHESIPPLTEKPYYS